jgi:glycosyltransferase involved in cell wall biosynthesis
MPFVTTYHGAYNETNALKSLYNGVMARGDVVIANSQYTADLIGRRYGTPAGRLAVIHRGVDCDRLDPARIGPERIVALRERWGVSPTAPIVLHAARLTAWKGQGVLIQAAALLKARGRLGHAVVVLAGDAQDRHAYLSALQAQIAETGLDGNVRIVGHVEDVAAAYLAAHVTVVASTEPEAFGRATIEAAAMGSPVIATDIGAPPEIILAQPRVTEEVLTGWLVPPGDAGALAVRLEEALSIGPAARAAIGARARARGLEHFTVQAMHQRTLAVYDRLLGTRLERSFASAREPTDAIPRHP